MDYPEKLDEHKTTQVFDLDDGAYRLRERRAYYHDDFPLPMHAHNFYELNIVTAGRGRHYIEDKSYPVERGDVFALPPGVRHGYWAPEGTDMRIFHLLIEKRVIVEYHSQLNSFPGFYVLFEIEPQIRRQSGGGAVFLNLNGEQLPAFKKRMDELVQLERETFPGRDVSLDLYTVCLLCDLSRLISTEGRLDERRPDAALYIVRAVEYMKARLDEKITVDALAARALMSRATFVRAFKKFLGVPPMQYLKTLRVRHAVELLETTDQPVVEVALACGFFDSSHFIRTFRQITGRTPAAYKNG